MSDSRSSEPIKISYVINRMDVGGTQTHLLQVLRLLDRGRFSPQLICLSGEGALLDQARELGVGVLDGGVRGSFKSPQTLLSAIGLSGVLRRVRPDIAHNYLLRANAIGSVAARLAGVPIVLSSKRGCHERRGWELAGARLGNRLSDCVTTNAEAVRDFVHDNESCPLDKMVVIPSGVDCQKFRPMDAAACKRKLGLAPDARVVGVVTRMRVRKGVEEFLRAMVQVRQRFPDTQAVVAGEVDLDPALDRLVADCGLGDALHLLGRRDDMPEVLAAFDVFVLSSHDEGMSNAILEAMAMEKAVVATDVGGTGEVVAPGVTGLLVPPRRVEPLAQAIVELLQEPDVASAMGQRGREIVVDQFSARAMVREMEGMYSQWMHRVGERRRWAPRLAAGV